MKIYQISILSCVFCLVSLLGGFVQQSAAAPVVQSIQVSPAIVAPDLRYHVRVDGENIALVTGSLNLAAFGAVAEEPVFSLINGGWEARGKLPKSLIDLSATSLSFDFSAKDASGETVTNRMAIPLQATAPTLDPGAFSVSPESLRVGKPFTISVVDPDAITGSMTLDFRPRLAARIKVPLIFADGIGSASGTIPPDYQPSESPLNIVVNTFDRAENRRQTLRSVIIGSADQVSAGRLSVQPNPLVPGRSFTITVPASDAVTGSSLVTFEPFSNKSELVTLEFVDGVGTGSGTVPAEIAFGTRGFAQIKTSLFAAGGLGEFTFTDSIPLIDTPPAADISVTIASPPAALVTSQAQIDVTGIVGADVRSVEVNGVEATLADKTYTAKINLKEGRNEVSVVAMGPAGELGTRNISVTRDTVAPIFNVEVPASGSVVTSPQVTVAGFINDVVAGTVNEDDVTIMVAGLPARVVNRSYEKQELPLRLGSNVIEVVATDRAGNSRRQTIDVTYQDSSQQRIRIAGGNNQMALIGEVLPDPLGVQLVDRNGVPLENLPVTFEVIRGDGLVMSFPEESRKLTIHSNKDGLAESFFQLGSRTGQGNNRVKVTSPGFSEEMIFCASSFGSRPAVISALMPTSQVGEVGSQLPLPFQVYVTDTGGNPIANTPVTFRVISGDGTIDGVTTLTLDTNENGRATVNLTLGALTETNGHIVFATLAGDDSGDGALFTATARQAGLAEDTSLVGLVLDAGNRPIPEATVHVQGQSNSVKTNEQGQFKLMGVPVGALRLIVEGSTTTLPGEWPELEYDLVTVAGRENSVDRPIYLLPLDTKNAKVVGGDQEVTLEMAGIPGAKLTVFPNSVKGPNGESEVLLKWTQVNLERVPMSPPNGSQFMLAATLQPAGVRFDPPARIQIPNMGAPPGQQVEIFSFDHDVGEFVALGVATISKDGQFMASDSGFGLTKSGWHGCVPPPPPCRPVQGNPPMDTPCVKFKRIPADSRCAYDRYEPQNAKVTKLDATANGSAQPADVPVGADVSFTAMAESEFCDGLEYEWSGFPGGVTKTGASTSFKFEEEGMFTITVKAQCTGCPSASKTASVKVNVINDKVPLITDSDGRKASRSERLLQIVTQSSEVIRGEAMFPTGVTPPAGKPEWMITGPGQNSTQIGKSVSFSASRGNPIAPDQLILVDITPTEYTITCDGEVAARVVAFDGTRKRIRFNFQKAEDIKKSIERALNLVLGGVESKSEFLKGRGEFINEWKECSDWRAGWSFRASGTYDPLIGYKGRVNFGPSTVIPGFIRKWVAAGFFVEFGGGIFTRVSIEKQPCMDIFGSGTVGGKINLAVGGEAIAADLASFVVKGATEVEVNAEVFVNEKGISFEGVKGFWKGIFVDVSIKMLWGWVEVERRWDVIEGQELFGGASIRIQDF